MSAQEVKPWVIVSSLNQDITEQDVERVGPKIALLVDKWQEKGRLMWSGDFSDQPSGMAIFEATDDEAKTFYKEYSDAAEKVLTHQLYQWSAMPILSLLC